MLEGKTAAAITSFDRALALAPTLEAARFNRGLTYLRMQDYARAASDLNAVYANEHSEFRADAAYHLGITSDRLQKPAEAEEWLHRALALDPALDAALLYSGMLRERRNDLQGAGRAYLTYLQKHPASTTAMLRFALSAQKAGRFDVARNYLERVIKAAPESADAIEARKYLVLWE